MTETNWTSTILETEDPVGTSQVVTSSELRQDVTDTQLFVIKFCSIYGAALGTIGNMFTIAAILKGNLQQQSIFLKILNLSICNLIHCLVFLPLIAVQAFVGLWDSNSIYCNLISYGLFSNMGTEILGCVCITLNRYLCVVHHKFYEKFYNTKTKLAIQWILVWLVYPVILGLPLFNILGHYEYIPQKLICHPFSSDCGTYCLIVFLPTLASFPTIGYCYIHILYVYFKVKHKVGLSRDSPNNSGTSEHSLYRSTDHHRTRAEIRMTFTILAVVLVFAIFRLPFMFLYVYDPAMTKIDPLIHTILIYAGINANWINPLIYAYTNKQIRKSLKTLWPACL